MVYKGDVSRKLLGVHLVLPNLHFVILYYVIFKGSNVDMVKRCYISDRLLKAFGYHWVYYEFHSLSNLLLFGLFGRICGRNWHRKALCRQCNTWVSRESFVTATSRRSKTGMTGGSIIGYAMLVHRIEESKERSLVHLLLELLEC